MRLTAIQPLVYQQLRERLVTRQFRQYFGIIMIEVTYMVWNRHRIWITVNKVCGSPAGKAAGTLIVVILGIIGPSFLRKSPARPSASAVANGSATAQSSSGSQSSNLSGGHHNVQIIYGPTGTQSPTPPGRAVIRQSSTGDQSPNINGVGGDVDIHYESSPSVTR
jgi:hypothetical protein